MSAKLKTPIFIDSVVFVFPELNDHCIRATLKDESGIVCSTLDAEVPQGARSYRWNGLNDLPYGVYTIEYAHDGMQESQRMVKRI